MLDALKQFLGRQRAGAGDGGTPTAGAPVDDLQVAACALLLELAHADGDFSAAERAHLESALGRHFALDANATRELIAVAAEERRRSIDHFQFTRSINQAYDLGQKMVLAEVMWGVILADGTLQDREAQMVRKLAHLLDLEPGYLAQARKGAAGR